VALIYELQRLYGQATQSRSSNVEELCLNALQEWHQRSVFSLSFPTMPSVFCFSFSISLNIFSQYRGFAPSIYQRRCSSSFQLQSSSSLNKKIEIYHVRVRKNLLTCSCTKEEGYSEGKASPWENQEAGREQANISGDDHAASVTLVNNSIQLPSHQGLGFGISGSLYPQDGWEAHEKVRIAAKMPKDITCGAALQLLLKGAESKQTLTSASIDEDSTRHCTSQMSSHRPN
jgi:hypothetical protein